MTDPIFILQCLPPSRPLMECNTTRIYGAPRTRAGRIANGNPIPISGIAVHCVRDTFDGFLNKTCRGNGSLNPYGHASFHYIIDGDTGRISSLVDEANLAWSFQSYPSNFPTITPTGSPPCPPNNCPPDPCDATYPPPDPPYPGWPELSALFPNLSADFFTINIGITVPTQITLDESGCEVCLGIRGMRDNVYDVLVHLIAWIAYNNNIPISGQRIAFHDDIVFTILGCEECPCPGGCLHCAVSHYCEECKHPGDPTFVTSDNIVYIYGVNENGCKVKIHIDHLRELLNA